ncbi:alanine--glyoxylate aminotransferase 2 1 mitochondrial-like isoform X3 [Tripterygium wilfordii]|uniref:Alanine--glyoxylate aminotransferase 2 1 mitochondrial-like isoform X3 n=1 Tax=Tripterygium wilfordii TaxID=458696 RepID=A0A7J7CUY2_TRIWF|nr:alanine--glyoxylate aminotransferase 2 1 mitochondrial-like isoform X3 [Tripterygium wilfordii]
MELTKGFNNKTRATELAAAVFERLRDVSVLVGRGGLHGNVIRINHQCVSQKTMQIFFLMLLAIPSQLQRTARGGPVHKYPVRWTIHI